MKHTHSDRAWNLLGEWLQQAEQHEKTKADADRPDHSLVVQALQTKAIGGRTSIEAETINNEASIRFHLSKPRGEGVSIRDLDPEAAVLLALLRLPGAGIALEPKGAGNKYYGRLTFYGIADRRAVVVRIIAETPTGLQTDEPDDFHSWLRRDLCYRSLVESDTPGEYGVEDAKAFAKERLREVLQKSPNRLPKRLTEELYAERLTLAHRLMSKLPLGKAKQGA